MRKKVKKLIIIIVAFITIIVVFLEMIHPVFINADTLVCGVSNEYVSMLQDDEYYDIYLDNFNGKLPSQDSKNYRRLTLRMDLIYTSLLAMESMQIYVKNIDCENKKNVVMTRDGGLSEGSSGEMRVEKESISGIFMLVYVGDLKTESEIRNRLKDIAKHTTFEVMYNMQWFGNRTYSWRRGKTIDNYVIKDETNGGETDFDE